MEAPYSTLEEYGELLRIACEKARRAKAHTCEYCAQISIEIPEDAEPIEKAGRRLIHCPVKGLPGDLQEGTRRTGCRLSDTLYKMRHRSHEKNDDGWPTTVVLQEARKNSHIGSLTELDIMDPADTSPVSRRYAGNVFCDEGPNLILLFEREMFD